MSKETNGNGQAAPTGEQAADGENLLLAQVAAMSGMQAPTAEQTADGGEETPANAEGAADGGEQDPAGNNPEGEGASGESGDADAETAEGDGVEDAQNAETDDAAHEAVRQETARLVNAELKHLPKEVRERVQAVIDKRIGKVIAKERTTREALAVKNAELEQALEAANQSAASANAPAIPGVHPLMLAKTEAELDARLAQIDQAEDFATQFWDGYPGDEDNPNDRPMEAAAIRKSWHELKRERDRIIPAARQLLKDRAAFVADTRKIAPTFFDQKSADYTAVQTALKLMPEISARPDAAALAVKLVLGDRALQAIKAKAAKPPASTAAAPKKAPKVPGSGGPAKGDGAAPARGSSASPQAQQELMQANGTAGIVNVVERMLQSQGF